MLLGGIFDEIFYQREKPLVDEERQLAEGTHPKFLHEAKLIREEYQRELEMDDILEKEEISRIQEDYNAEMKQLDAEYEQRLTELTETLYNEIEEKKKQLEVEINTLEIATTSNTHSNYYYGLPNKKTLRKRPNEQQTSEGSAYGLGPNSSDKAGRFGSSGGGTGVSVGSRQRGGLGMNTPQTIAQLQLLSDTAIASDVRMLCGGLPSGRGWANNTSNPSGGGASCNWGLFGTSGGPSTGISVAVPSLSFASSVSASSGGGYTSIRTTSADSEESPQKPRRIAFENNKLLYDGKSFHRGQSVTIQSANYAKFSAILQAVTDKYVVFKSAIPGDTRQVTATRDDLESGLVVVKKRY